MRVAIRHIAGHLLWSTHGSVWAVYRLHPGPDAPGGREEMVQGTHVPGAVREEQLAKVTHVVRSLSGAAPRLFGLCAQVDPGEIALKMIEGIEPAGQAFGAGRHPWVENVEATLELLDGQEMHRRTLWLAVPLHSETGSRHPFAQLGAAWAEMAAMLGMRPAPVTRREVTAHREAAVRVEAALAGALAFRPARPAEIVWMIQHALHRGLAEPLLTEAETSTLYGGRLLDGVLHSPSYADLGQARLQEGGIDPGLDDADDLKMSGRIPRPGKAWWRVNTGSPLRRRWLQIESDTGVGYQAQLALAECPPAVGQDAADLFAQLELLDFPVDYTVDLTLVPAEKAREQVRRKKNELIDQADQYDARPTGMPASLTEAAHDLGELDARLSRTSVEVEVQSVTVLTVWGPTAAVCDARARALTALLGGADYRAVRPAGLQEALFTLGLPGTVRPGVVREFTQHQISEDWALAGAFTTAQVGDPNGMFLGIDLDCGTTRPVMINVADAPKVDASASMGIVGDLGAGKSVLQKLIAEAVWARGGCAICIDRTPVREWATFAHTAAKGLLEEGSCGVSLSTRARWSSPSCRTRRLTAPDRRSPTNPSPNRRPASGRPRRRARRRSPRRCFTGPQTWRERHASKNHREAIGRLLPDLTLLMPSIEQLAGERDGDEGGFSALVVGVGFAPLGGPCGCSAVPGFGEGDHVVDVEACGGCHHGGVVVGRVPCPRTSLNTSLSR
ncbi:hypothetical protein ACFY2D_35330 [Streptomyces nigra]|uniref:hypothetical protein n=1 Tax=Streptomyces nigra TaxID=1827580 RepID=UPI0036AAF70F